MPNSVAIVTGASQGIGKATALRLARDFSSLVLIARDELHLQETAQQAKSSGAESLVLPLDLREATAAEKVVNDTLERFGRIDAANRNSLCERLFNHSLRPKLLALLLLRQNREFNRIRVNTGFDSLKQIDWISSTSLCCNTELSSLFGGGIEIQIVSRSENHIRKILRGRRS